MKLPEPIPEKDRCDLDPNKVCDNCCKCIDSPEEYHSILADMDPDAIRIFSPDEEDDAALSQEPLPEFEIDPALMAEWEEKLRLAEEAEGEGRSENKPLEEPLPEPIGYRGARKRRPHVPRKRD